MHLRKFISVELIILFIVIGVFAKYEYDNYEHEYSKRVKASQDCDTFCQRIQKCGSLMLKKYDSEKDSRSPSIGELRDPWGSLYQFDLINFRVYSKGYDKIAGTGDDVYRSYCLLGDDFTLADAKIEINPANIKESSKAYDILHLYFNKSVYLSDEIKINMKNAALQKYFEDDTIAVTAAFRYYDRVGKYLIEPPSRVSGGDTIEIIELPADMRFAADGDIRKDTKTGLFYWGNSSNEILLRFPDGCSNVIMPQVHCINVTGSAKTRNCVFFKSGENGKKETGARAFIWPIIISAYNNNKAAGAVVNTADEIKKYTGITLDRLQTLFLPDGMGQNNKIKLTKWIDGNPLPAKDSAIKFKNVISVFVFNEWFDYYNIAIKIARFASSNEAQDGLLAIYPYETGTKAFDNFDKSIINNGFVKIGNGENYKIQIFITYKNYSAVAVISSIYGLYNEKECIKKIINIIAVLIDESGNK